MLLRLLIRATFRSRRNGVRILPLRLFSASLATAWVSDLTRLPLRLRLESLTSIRLLRVWHYWVYVRIDFRVFTVLVVLSFLLFHLFHLFLRSEKRTGWIHKSSG